MVAKKKKKQIRDRGKYYAVFSNQDITEYKSEYEMKLDLNRDDLPDVLFLARGKRLQASIQPMPAAVVVEAYKS